MTGVGAFGFGAAADAIERRLVGGLKLESVPAFGHLSEGKGSWKGEAVHWRAAAWEGPRIALLRTVRVIGEHLDIVNVLAWARAPLAAPIFGADFVAARPDSALVVADLSPLDPPGASHAELPAWAQPIFSAAPLLDRVTTNSAPGVLGRVHDLASTFVTEVQNATAAPDAAARAAAVERYRASHLEDDRMRTMLTHMFGAVTADRLLQTVLFPRESTLDVHA